LLNVVKVFREHAADMDSSKHTLTSNEVLLVIKKSLLDLHFRVERGQRIDDKIRVPVLFGREGQMEKSFQVDAFQADTGTVLEVEAGRAVTNYQFLKDLFEACMMSNVLFLVIAVRKMYRRNADFEKVLTHFDTLYSSGRLKLPLKGILIIGY